MCIYIISFTADYRVATSRQALFCSLDNMDSAAHVRKASPNSLSRDSVEKLDLPMKSNAELRQSKPPVTTCTYTASRSVVRN